MRGMSDDLVLKWDADPVTYETEVRNERGELIPQGADGTVTIPATGTYTVRTRSTAVDGRYSEAFGTLERD
jgi:hypothetical protein